MNRGRIIFWVALITAGASFVGWSYNERNSAEQKISAQASLSVSLIIGNYSLLVVADAAAARY